MKERQNWLKRWSARVEMRRRGAPCAGFTMIELMIVIAIILILLGMAAQRYDMTIQRSREATLKHDLMVMRQAIDDYTLDKQAAPQSLDDLQQAGYLREVPLDPVTHQKDWVPQFDNVVMSPDQVTTGMVDVHSNSQGSSPFDHTAYNTW
ncbi:MAG TPA: prepilin-type N-terminal cleavage/methylation domain-containing protein [Dongiaceae bacterium]|nr:prepilin-type N-terminal cleavage/methylation domain-containing protein [Dongiaceae bacterium]